MRKYSVRVSDPALEDLIDLSGFYLDLVNEESARKFEEDAQETIKSLETFPEGNPYFDEAKNLRRVNLKHHKIAVIYSVNNNVFEVMAISAFHTSQKPSTYTEKIIERLKEL